MLTQGLLVHGCNHFIVNGPPPGLSDARELVRRWEVPQIDRPAGAPWRQWSLCTNAFRENLAWAVIVESAEPHSEAVRTLLAEMAARGVVATRVPGIW
ncbi:MAG: hypothetical protein R2729_08495 [Bryobacteraceae bacterium]